ncbi:MAG TPA: M20/M25/M40 family metallo-hydrolase [Chitinophagaceae bacterium]|nr:M20/M25/M40 family metallo-hydrolase [Chitinophagaceae bacterium]
MRFFLVLLTSFSFLVGFAQDAMISRIREEGLKNSKVMDIAFRLTDVSGPRLTGSPGFRRAAEWAKAELTRMGLSNARLEPWGEFGKGWEQERCYVAMVSPYYAPLIAVPRAWTGSTGKKKPVRSEVVLIRARDTVELMQYSGKLKGKIVMTHTTDQLRPSFEADASRLADSTLTRMAASEGSPAVRGNQPRIDSAQRLQMLNRQAVQRRISEFYAQEKPALVLSMNVRGTDGTIFVSSGGSFAKDAPALPAMVMLSSDDYLRIQRLVEAGIEVQLEADVKTKFFTDDFQGYNVIAEIPGTDPSLKEELVMLGGHLDSWHGATGATDNASGCAVMMEAVRILKAAGFAPRRTIRIALWGGEEQGLIGSRNYVRNNFADPATMELRPAHGKISAYYNLDNGTGRIRGIYAQGNKAAAEWFRQWLEPFHDLGAKTVTINNTGSTDHIPFDAVGVPGFQFIQDPIEYSTRTHHTNMDTYDHLVADDLRQAAVIVAAFVYRTAQADEKIPRKELPKPQQPRGF